MHEEQVVLNSANYIGTWILIPELCIYQSGEAPLNGSYKIQSDGTDVRFSIVWTDIEGTDHAIDYGGPIDGSKHPIDSSGTTSASYLRVDENTLDSTVYDNDKKTMYARRIVSAGTDLLAVVQVEYKPEGKLSNFQVYRREGR